MIGHGGMGAVYRAHHAALARNAAVKVLLPELSHNRDLVARFFNEARAATAVRHPGIVEIFDFGYLPDGSGYIVMEFLEGETLGALRARLGRIPPARALTLTRQIAGALGAAHDRGIVHRDLKPDNVFLVADPEVPSGERIKVLDFGVAKLTATPGDTARTQTGSLLGTPTYMSPEQCRGTADVDGRTDLYALGCLLYELVCGQPPFVADSAGDLIAHHLYFEPPAPRTWEPALPSAIEQLIVWLLQKDPNARPQSTRELVEAIDRAMGTTGATSPVMRSEVLRSVSTNVASPSTLSAAAGVSVTLPRPPSRRWLIPTVSTALVVVGLGTSFVLLRGRDDAALPSAAAPPPPPVVQPAAKPPAPAPTPAAASTPAAVSTPAVAPSSAPAPAADQVHVTVDSDPSGATVLVDGKPVGATPFEELVPRAAGRRSYKLQKDGFDTARASADTAHDGVLRVTLKKKRARAKQDIGDKGVNPFE